MKKNISIRRPGGEDVASRFSVLCHDLEALPLTCIHFVREELCAQVGASFSVFQSSTSCCTSFVALK